MIHPDVRTHDLDPDGFAWLNALLAHRDQRRRRTATIVHDAGIVVQVVGDDATGVDVGSAVTDPTALAHIVRAAAAFDEVTVVDRSGLDDLSAQVVALGRTCPTQGELLWRSRELWNTHPAIAIAPDPAPSRWPAVAARVAAVPDGAWIVARAVTDGGSTFVLAGEVRAGTIVTLTSAPPHDAVVAVTIEGDADAVAAALTADDPLLALAPLIADA